MSEQVKRYFTEMAIYPEQIPIESVKDCFVVLADDHDAAINALHAEAEALRADQFGVCMMVAEAAIKWARGRDRAVSAEECRQIVQSILTATPAPEVRQDCEWCAGAGHDHFGDKCAHCNTRIDKVGEWRIDTSAGREILVYKDCNVIEAEDARYVMRLIAAEQGERQEAWANFDEMELCMHKPASGNWVKVYTTPQPGPDVQALAAALYQACGAYDMPERILDALSAAANGEPFAHMIDGLLPCVPPSDQDVRGLVSADDVRDACANAVSVFAEETNAGQCREVAEYMREVLLAQIARRQEQQGDSHG